MKTCLQRVCDPIWVSYVSFYKPSALAKAIEDKKFEFLHVVWIAIFVLFICYFLERYASQVFGFDVLHFAFFGSPSLQPSIPEYFMILFLVSLDAWALAFITRMALKSEVSDKEIFSGTFLSLLSLALVLAPVLFLLFLLFNSNCDLD